MGTKAEPPVCDKSARKSMLMRLAGCLAGSLLCLPVTAGQSSSPPQASSANTPTFQTGVHMVSVPVVARDHDGKAVADLTKDQFQVFDNGKKREIASFAVEQLGDQTSGEQPSGSAAAPAKPESEAGKPASQNIPQRFTAWVFDDLGIREETDVKEVRDAASHYFSDLSPGDRVAIFTTSCRISQNFTNDKAKLLEAVSRIAFKPLGVCRVPENESLQLVELKSLVKNMATLPGQRSVVFVSPGFHIPDDEWIRRQIDPTDTAVQSKVLINTLHLSESSAMVGDIMGGGRAPQPDQQAAATGDARPIEMIELSQGTGGMFVESGNDFSQAFRRLRTPGCIYLLGFSLDDVKPDGSFHHLKVTVKDPRRLTLQTRSGYYAPKHGEKPQ